MDSVIAPCAQDAIAVHAVATMLDLAAGMTITAGVELSLKDMLLCSWVIMSGENTIQ